VVARFAAKIGRFARLDFHAAYEDDSRHRPPRNGMSMFTGSLLSLILAAVDVPGDGTGAACPSMLNRKLSDPKITEQTEKLLGARWTGAPR
jgi:hypothetical protein